MNPIRVAILTTSDRSARGERPDLSGPALKEVALQQGWQIAAQEILPDDLERISHQLVIWSDSNELDLILITGGTGFAERDVTPEATLRIIDRQTPGLAELMRAEGLKITPHAALSRAISGIRKKTLIINLPGSPKGAVENLGFILPLLPHAISVIRGVSMPDSGHKYQN
jgi:molybdenum cofactor synthesis domain-containing protein